MQQCPITAQIMQLHLEQNHNDNMFKAVSVFNCSMCATEHTYHKYLHYYHKF